MDTQPPAPTTAPGRSRRYWLRTAVAAVFAVFVSISVSAIGRSQLWPHPESIAFGVFLFLIPILQSVADRRRVRSWPLLLAMSVFIGAIGGFFHALVIER
jgi:uncharacterized membrane protein YfcA